MFLQEQNGTNSFVYLNFFLSREHVLFLTERNVQKMPSGQNRRKNSVQEYIFDNTAL